MKKTLLLISLLVVSLSLRAQLAEDFEVTTFPPAGWDTTYISHADLSLKVTAVPRWDLQKTKPSGQVFTGYIGGKMAIGYTGQTRSGKSLKADSWLISPKVEIADGYGLSFLLGGIWNNNTENNRFYVQVLVSTTDSLPESFTDTLFTYSPRTEDGFVMFPMATHFINLSKYVGKHIFVAFRNYGGEGAQSNMLTNNTYLDHVQIGAFSESPDLAVSNVTNVIANLNFKQTLKATVENSGKAVNSFNLHYVVNKTDSSMVAVSQPVGKGGSVEVPFSVNLAPGASNTIVAWAETDSDAFLGNSFTTYAVTMPAMLTFPYKMASSSTASTDFKTSASGTGKSAWKWYSNYSSYVYTYYPGTTAMLKSSGITLPKGDIMVSFDYQSATPFTMQALLGNYIKYVKCDSISLPATASDYAQGKFVIKVPADTTLSIALMALLGTESTQISVKNISIQTSYADAKAAALVSPEWRATLPDAGVVIKAQFQNLTAGELKNVPVKYQVGTAAAVIDTITSMAANATIVHSFATPIDLSVAGSYQLKVWIDLAGDGDLTNDTISTTLYSYNAKTLPYRTSFEPGEDGNNWNIYNPDNDVVYWYLATMVSNKVNYAKAGVSAAYINSYTGIPHNDWLISPAISLPAGKTRVSFYYTTEYSTGATNLKLYLSKSASPDSMKQSQPIFCDSITNVLYYKSGYALLDVKEAGNYYLGFYDEGSGRDIILDDVRVEQTNDLCLLSASSDVTEGYNLDRAKISVKFANHGIDPQTDIPLTFKVGTDASTFIETYRSTLNPGDTASYTFMTPIDVSTAGTYSIKVAVAAPNDSDSYNNAITVTVKNLACKTLPYVHDFEVAPSPWSLSGWIRGTSSMYAYKGTGVLYHDGKTTDDWAYSECINVPAGDYELSYFMRTFLNGTDTLRDAHSYDVCIGTDRAPEAMTKVIASFRNVLCSSKYNKKVIRTIHVDADSKLYIGFHYTGAVNANKNGIYIDYLTLKAQPTTATAAMPYSYNFTTPNTDWYHYYPTTLFEQWKIATDASGSSCMKTKRTVSVTSSELAGPLESKSFSLIKGDSLIATFDYAITADSVGPTINLALSSADDPAAFTDEANFIATGGDVTSNVITATGKTVVPADGIYYLAFVPRGEQTFSMYLYNASFMTKQPTGITSARSLGSYRLVGRTLYLPDGCTDACIFTTEGLQMCHVANVSSISLADYPSGLYIVRLSANGKLLTGKIFVK